MEKPTQHPHEYLTHLDDPWRMFRIMAEFVDGFEILAKTGPVVSVFGSARAKASSPHYTLALEAGKKIANKGFGVITGGGPGVMEAVNKGVQEAGGKSCGLCISLPFETRPNDYIDPDLLITFRYFFIRKVMFVRYAMAVVVLPGGYGTLDEFFEAITLIQTNKTRPFPVYLVGKEYWSKLYDWITDVALPEDMITPEDLDLFTLTDDLDFVVEDIQKHFNDTSMLENF